MVKGYGFDLREAAVFEEKSAEEIDGAPVAAGEGGRVGSGRDGLFESGSDGAERVGQAVVRYSNHS